MKPIDQTKVQALNPTHTTVNTKADNNASSPYNLYDNLEQYRDYKYFHRSFNNPKETQSVTQGQVLVRECQLTTAGLGSCSALAFAYDGKNFMTHVDAKTSVSKIKSEIEQNFDIEKLKGDENFRIHLWQGCLYGTNHAINIAGQALEELGLLKKLNYCGGVTSIGTTVGINSRGTFEEEPHNPSMGNSLFTSRFQTL